MAAVLLALSAAALWGTGDFFGGLVSRRMTVLVVLFWSQLAGLVVLATWIILAGDGRPGTRLLFAVGAGLAGVIGLGCLYRGMAVGAMGIVAPISATSPAVPLVVDVFHGHSPSAPQWVGIGLALTGIVLLSREPGAIRRPAAGVGLALFAALGFGLFLVGIEEAAQDSAPWAAGGARLGSISALVIALAWTRTPPRVSARLLPVVIAVGVFDAGANAFLALAASRGPIGIVAVLSSFYPIATILLARAVLHERLGRTRTAGGLIAVGGAAMIAAG